MSGGIDVDLYGWSTHPLAHRKYHYIVNIHYGILGRTLTTRCNIDIMNGVTATKVAKIPNQYKTLCIKCKAKGRH